MKQYEYEHINIGRFVGAKSDSHRAIIDTYAAKGYRYVGYIPTKISEYGIVKELDLIFEKDLVESEMTAVEENVALE